MVWDPQKYVQGNYFQHEISEIFRKNFKVKPFGTILDVGCGDGHYTRLLADHYKYSHIIAIDNSKEMIQYANQHHVHKNLSFEESNIEAFQSNIVFDFVLSFWCLHWTDIKKSFPRIVHSLKDGGRFYAVLSSFSNNSILQACQELAKENRYAVLTERYINSEHQYKNYFYTVVNTLTQLPFKQIQIDVKTMRVLFPDIIYFKNLLLTMPFIKTFPLEIRDSLVDDLVSVFRKICQRNYDGALYYETRPIFLEAIK